jgi:hypothetical protein
MIKKANRMRTRIGVEILGRNAITRGDQNAQAGQSIRHCRIQVDDGDDEGFKVVGKSYSCCQDED